jgi:hypothetical protein
MSLDGAGFDGCIDWVLWANTSLADIGYGSAGIAYIDIIGTSTAKPLPDSFNSGRCLVREVPVASVL